MSVFSAGSSSEPLFPNKASDFGAEAVRSAQFLRKFKVFMDDTRLFFCSLLFSSSLLLLSQFLVESMEVEMKASYFSLSERLLDPLSLEVEMLMNEKARFDWMVLVCAFAELRLGFLPSTACVSHDSVDGSLYARQGHFVSH